VTPPGSSEPHGEVRKLRIDRSPRLAEPKPARERVVLITIGIAVVLVAGVVAVRLLSGSAPEVETARATPVTAAGPGVALSATGYIVAHHKIAVNSKVTGRVRWIGVEKGDSVKAGQVVVELEDNEFLAQRTQARGQVEAARALLRELQAGSRPQEVEQARDNMEEARATLRNDQATLDRTRQLADAGLIPRQQLDDVQARFEADQHKVASLEQTHALSAIGPRQEEIQRARGALTLGAREN
jgi:multidrug resistance efflux pump